MVWLGGILSVLLLLLLAGAISESSSEAADRQSYPPPGQMVDVCGHRLHLNCTGDGSPTVVIEAGWGDWSNSWGLVQPDVAKVTRVCTYDRAGMGWSEPGPLPRDAVQFAKELHALLHNANIPGPYLMVGHSLGGLPVRVFTHDYPTEVAGVVLIESMVPKQFSQPGAAASSQPAAPSRSDSILWALARFGVMRLLVKPLGIATCVPPNDNACYSRVVRPEHVQAYLDEGRGLPASGVEAAAVTNLGDIPLIVLTARHDSSNPKDWQAWQRELLQLSSQGEQVFAEKSGHNIELDEPQAAVDAIVGMVEQLRK
jgi:pimeloyl-ACP methyl ester carboxylesterase